MKLRFMFLFIIYQILFKKKQKEAKNHNNVLQLAYVNY